MSLPSSPAAPPRIARAPVLAGIVVLLMIGCGLNIALNDGFGHGAGLDTFNAGAGNPWQLFINMDLLSGLLLMLGWMLWRERGGPLAARIAWTLLTLWWGNIVVACYLLLCAWQSGGDAATFFMGRHAPGARIRRIDELGALPRLLGLAGAALAGWALFDGLRRVGLQGEPAFGYLAAFGTLVFGFLVLAISGAARAPDH